MDTLLNNVKKLYFRGISVIDSFMPYIRTIRFKLAFLYSSILFIFTGTLVLGFNLYLGNTLHKDPVSKYVQVLPFGSPILLFEDFNKLQGEERQRIRNIRLNDLRKFQELSVLALFPLAITSFFVGYFLSGKFLEPISRLQANIEKLDTKDIGIKFDTEDEDEVGALINSFNDLSARLQDAFNSQEQFVQNASHELRTPLTIIQTNLDTVLDNPNATKEEMATAVTQALTGVQHLKSLVKYLLELTTTSVPDFKKQILQQIVKTQVLILGDYAHSHNSQIRTDDKIEKNVKIEGDELQLGRVIFNILENAIKYATGDVPHIIAVSLSNTNKKVILRITNSSDSLSNKELKKIFDRFYQVNPSRSKKVSGYGLGLAIAKKIILEHNGTISAYHEKGLTTVELTLPATK